MNAHPDPYDPAQACVPSGAELHFLRQLEAALNAHAVVAVTDARGMILEVNEHFCTLSQYSRDELIGRTHAVVNSRHHDREFWLAFWRTIARGSIWRGEICNRAKDGSLYWVDTTVVPFRDQRGRIERFVAIRADITARKHAEAAEREAMARLRLATASSNTGLWEWNAATNGVYFCPVWKQQLGWAEDEMPNTLDEWSKRVHPDDMRDTMRRLKASIDDPSTPYENEYRLRHRDGRYRWILTKAAVIRDPDGRAARFLGSHTDVTERRELEAALLDGVTHEQQRLAADLHDGLAQELVGLSLLLATTAHRAQSGLPVDPAHIGHLAELASAAVGTARQMAHGIAPAAVQLGGLGAALERAARMLAGAAGITVHAELAALRGVELPAATAEHIYRIAQEAIGNAVRHGAPRDLWMRATVDGERLTLVIEDNGTGAGDLGATGMGMRTMQYRARLIGASLDVQARAEGGMRVRCSCALSSAAI